MPERQRACLAADGGGSGSATGGAAADLFLGEKGDEHCLGPPAASVQHDAASRQGRALGAATATAFLATVLALAAAVAIVVPTALAPPPAAIAGRGMLDGGTCRLGELPAHRPSQRVRLGFTQLEHRRLMALYSPRLPLRQWLNLEQPELSQRLPPAAPAAPRRAALHRVDGTGRIPRLHG